jgi:hypothetical protein
MMRALPLLALIVAGLSLAGCGRVATLQRTKEMRPLPVAVGATRPATAEELVQPSAQSRRSRTIDVLTHSDKRPVDPFDLPPGPDNGRQK